MQGLIDYLLEHPGRLGLCILIALTSFPFLRALIWRLFRFEKRVNKIVHQKKSSEVRLGKISESLAPVLKDFPVDVSKPGTSTIFLGQPIDYIHFDPEEGVTFIEIKSGESKLSDSQRKLKKLLEKGKVNWQEYRVK